MAHDSERVHRVRIEEVGWDWMMKRLKDARVTCTRRTYSAQECFSRVDRNLDPLISTVPHTTEGQPPKLNEVADLQAV